ANAGSAGIELLEELCAQGESAVAADDVDAAVALNARLHATVMELAGNAVLAELAGQVDRRVRWYYTPIARRRGRQSWIEHRELIAAIADRDEQRATAVMRQHTEHTRKMYHDREK
ncbi:FCD domain-containing protein, partial [Streptomyces sp. NPDC088921]